MTNFDTTEKFRVTVKMKSGGVLDLGTHETLQEAMAAVDDFKLDRPEVKWIARNSGTAGQTRHSYVVAIGQDGVTDPSIVVTKVEARTR